MNPMTITLIVLVLAIVLYASEKIPLALTSILIVVSLSLTKVLSASDALGGFSNTTVVLFAAIFVLGGALEKTSISNKIGDILYKYSNNERLLITATIAVTAVFSAFLSNTAVAAILLPIILSICSSVNISRSKLLLPMATGAVIGGGITLIGGPGNAFVVTSLEDLGTGQTYSFFDFTVVGLPIAILAVLYVFFIGWKLLPDYKLEEMEIKTDKNSKGRLSAGKEKLAYLIIVLTILGLIFSAQIGYATWLIAMVGAVLLVLTGVMSEKEALDSISWKTLIMFAGVLPLTTALKNTGGADLIASGITTVLGDSTNVFLITAVMFGLSAVVTQFMSNTATLALLCPLAGIIAQSIGADPRSLIMAAASGAALSICTPIGAPPQALIYGPGGYKFMDYIKFAAPIVVICFLFATFYLPIVWPYY